MQIALVKEGLPFDAVMKMSLPRLEAYASAIRRVNAARHTPPLKGAPGQDPAKGTRLVPRRWKDDKHRSR